MLGESAEGRGELVIEGMFTYAYRRGEWALIPPYYNPYGKEDGELMGLGYGSSYITRKTASASRITWRKNIRSCRAG